MTTFLIITLIKIAVVLAVLLTALAYIVWIERKVAGHIQLRQGPRLVGPFGLLQPLADRFKFIFKEDTPPTQIEGLAYYLAPFMAMFFAMLSIAVIPFGDATMVINGQTVQLELIANLNIGILFIFAVTS